MGTAYVSDGLAMSVRAKWVLRAVLAVAVVTGAFFFWRGAQPPSFEEQYRTLMGAEPITSTEFDFVRMSSTDTLAEAKAKGSTTIFGHFDGPGLRNVVVYWIFESPEAALETFDQQREHYAERPGSNFHEFGGEGMWAPHDFKITLANHARYVTYKDNVIIMGESWRLDPADVENRDLEYRADAMIRTAYKTYVGLFGN